MPKVRWEVSNTTNEANGDDAVITKKLVGHADNSRYPKITVDIQLTLSTPARATGPVPVIMEFGGFGGPRPECAGPPPNFARAGAPGPPRAPIGPTWQQQALAK